MRPGFRRLLAGVTAAALMGGTALAQQVILVPGPDGQGAGSGEEQRFILVPAPRAPDQSAQSGADSSMAMELYRRGYQQGASDAERAGASRQQIDPGAIERIGRELFERGYVLGMMQAQLQAQQAAQQTGQQQTGQQQGAQQQGGQQQGGQQADQQQGAQQQAGQRQGEQQQGGHQTAQAQTTQQGGQQAGGQEAAGQQGAQQTTGQQGGSQPLVESQVGATAQTNMPAALIRTEDSQEHGQHLVDANGRALYLFTADTQGQGDAQQASSACQDDCAAAWPPVLTQSGSAHATGAANADMLGTIQRQDGTMQVTYNGWPLYYYTQDEGQDQATGQDVESFGGEWYLVTPEGEKVGHN